MWDDIRLAWRALRGMPGVTAVVVVSLAVGIGVNTAVFSWMQALVLNPIPGVDAASTIHAIEPRSETRLRPGASWLEYRDLAERVGALGDLAAFRMVPFNVGLAPDNERTYGLLVSGNYFSVLGLTAERGRLLRADDAARPGSEAVAVVSHAFWQTRLGARADVVGARVRVNDQDLTVVGVTPDRFQGTVLGLQFDLWVPATMAPVLLAGSSELDDRTVRGYVVMGRLRPGTSLAQASAEATAAMTALSAEHPESNTGVTADVLPFWRTSRGPQEMVVQAVALLQVVTLMLLAGVCANAANLLLARAVSRQREVGVRMAMGARPWRVVAQMLTENVLMAIMAAGLGTILAYWGSQALRAGSMLSTAVPVRFESGLDGWTLLFIAALAVVSAVAIGIVPALHLAHLDPIQALNARRASGMSANGRLRNTLMATQVAVALSVLLVAGLFLRSLQDTRDIDPGFRRDGLLLAAYDLSGRQPGDASAGTVAARLLTRLGRLPGVEAVAIATSVPLDIHGLPVRGFRLEGRARTDGAVDRSRSNVVTPGYFAVMGIPVVAGSDFAGFEDDVAPAQVLVNEAFVATFIGEGQALGRKLWNNDREYVIAGVVGTTINDSFNEGATPCLYFSYRDRPSATGELHLALRPGTEGSVGAALNQAVREVERTLPLYNLRTMAEHLDTSLFLRKVPARMFAVLGPLLLLLAAVGIYAVVAYTVSQRTAEIGIRLALGATTARVVADVVGDTVKVIAAGATVGWVAVYVVYIHLAPAAPRSLAVFAGIPVLLLVVGTLASWAPTRRIAAVDPTDALKRT